MDSERNYSQPQELDDYSVQSVGRKAHLITRVDQSIGTGRLSPHHGTPMPNLSTGEGQVTTSQPNLSISTCVKDAPNLCRPGCMSIQGGEIHAQAQAQMRSLESGWDSKNSLIQEDESQSRIIMEYLTARVSLPFYAFCLTAGMLSCYVFLKMLTAAS